MGNPARRLQELNRRGQAGDLRRGGVLRRVVMAAKLRLYAPPDEEVRSPQEPDVRVPLGDLLPLVSMAQRITSSG